MPGMISRTGIADFWRLAWQAPEPDPLIRPEEPDTQDETKRSEFKKEIADYEEKLRHNIEIHQSTSTTIRSVFYSLLTTCLFCLAVLFNPEQGNLSFINSKITLPILNYEMNFVAFLSIGPAVIVALTVYLHIFLAHHRFYDVPPDQRLPTLFNIPVFPARLTIWLIFYWMVPVTLSVFAWKARPLNPEGDILLIATILVSLALTVIQIRRSPSGQRSIFALLAFSIFALFTYSIFNLMEDRVISLANEDLTGRDLRRTDLHVVNVRGANLTGATLSGVDLTDLQLADIDFTNADLSRADLTDVNLQGATLVNAILVEANLTRADLTGADLSGAILSGATIARTALVGTNLEGAVLDGTKFQNVDLTEALSLNPLQLRTVCRDAKVQLGEKVETLLDRLGGAQCGSVVHQIELDEPFKGEIINSGGAYPLDMKIENPGIYQIRVSGSGGFDPFAYLHRFSEGEGLESLAQNDDGGKSFNSLIIANLLPGHYLLKIEDTHGGMGKFRAELSLWDDQTIVELPNTQVPKDDDIEDLPQVPIQNHAIPFGATPDPRWFRFVAPDDADYTISLAAPGPGDPSLYIFDPNKLYSPIKWNDNDGSTDDSLLELRLEAGPYLLAIKNIGDSDEFQLSIRQED